RSESGVIRHNFSQQSEEFLNNLVNILITGCYGCESMAYYFDRSDIGLYGIADFCRYSSFFVMRLNKTIMDYIVERGGKISLVTIPKPDWGHNINPIKFMECLLGKLRDLYNFGLKAHENADIKNDPNLTDFLEIELIEPVSMIIREIEVMLCNMNLAGTGLGEFEFNKDLERYLHEYVDEKLSLLDKMELEQIWL
ncbi:ferritin, partial [Brachionus plicatilis]